MTAQGLWALALGGLPAGNSQLECEVSSLDQRELQIEGKNIPLSLTVICSGTKEVELTGSRVILGPGTG